MGNKVLRQRLKGPALASYYPRKVVDIHTVMKSFGPHLTTFDLKNEERLDHIASYVGTMQMAISDGTLTDRTDAKLGGRAHPRKRRQRVSSLHERTFVIHTDIAAAPPKSRK